MLPADCGRLSASSVSCSLAAARADAQSALTIAYADGMCTHWRGVCLPMVKKRERLPKPVTACIAYKSANWLGDAWRRFCGRR
eukprot:956544-Pleurochrysis_carterae.AAC.1